VTAQYRNDNPNVLRAALIRDLGAALRQSDEWRRAGEGARRQAAALAVDSVLSVEKEPVS